MIHNSPLSTFQSFLYSKSSHLHFFSSPYSISKKLLPVLPIYLKNFYSLSNPFIIILFTTSQNYSPISIFYDATIFFTLKLNSTYLSSLYSVSVSNENNVVCPTPLYPIITILKISGYFRSESSIKFNLFQDFYKDFKVNLD